jgi:hypothetical protein
MQPDASPGLPGLRVERRSDTNRLAKDFQARAYEELLPIRGRCPTLTAATAQAEVAWAGRPRSSTSSSKEGVAA